MIYQPRATPWAKLYFPFRENNLFHIYIFTLQPVPCNLQPVPCTLQPATCTL